MKYSKSLANRFKKDYNLPIPVPDDEIRWNYYVSNVFKNVNGKNVPELWGRFCRLVDTYRSEEDFFAAYTISKEQLMAYMQSTPGWKEFCNGPMDAYKTNLEFSTHSIYNKENVRKLFLSVDLASANVQAFNRAVSRPNTLTWNNFVNASVTDTTMAEHFCESKYIRQVVFGQLNPKRLITVEKKIISEVYDIIQGMNIPGLTFEKAMTDELIYRVGPLVNTDGLEKALREAGYNVHVKLLYFKEVVLYGNHTPECSAFLINDTHYKCVPEYFAPLFYAFLNYRALSGSSLQCYDGPHPCRHIEFNGFPAELTGALTLKVVE